MRTRAVAGFGRGNGARRVHVAGVARVARRRSSCPRSRLCCPLPAAPYVVYRPAALLPCPAPPTQLLHAASREATPRSLRSGFCGPHRRWPCRPPPHSPEPTPVLSPLPPRATCRPWRTQPRLLAHLRALASTPGSTLASACATCCARLVPRWPPPPPWPAPTTPVSCRCLTLLSCLGRPPPALA